MNISTNAKKVLEARYLQKDVNGTVLETPEEFFHRVADAVAAADLNYNKKADIKSTAQEFYTLMTQLDFLPNSPTLMNAGRPLGQLSACFVLPVLDSMEDIFETIKQAAIIHKSGGGTGFSFSRIRPAGASVNSTGGVASGPVSFMKVFNAATEAVKQGGTRRGANMGILRVDHPDILEFIDCKKDTSQITNFNISVGITERFMEAVKADQMYDLVDPRTRLVVGQQSARAVFDRVVESAWQSGEPGIIFLDRLNRDNVVPSQGEIESTNPCGEQPLLPYESCNLGSLNLANMITYKNDNAEIDFDKLGNTIETAIHFLDNVIDVNKYPLDIIEKTTKATRKIGLGVMGFADLLFSLGISYCSQEAVDTAKSLMKFIDDTAKQASIKLAEGRGTFPLYPESIYAGKLPLRNATVTTIAPTGTLSIIAGVSGGVEPVFALSYIRNVMDNTELVEVNPTFRAEMKKRGLDSDVFMKKIAADGGVHHIEEIPEDVKKIFVTAHDISPIWHTKMQAAFQAHTDNAVSKTVNFPQEATTEDVAQVFRLSYELGCKGVTIYRDGSRDLQVLNIGKVKGKEEIDGGKKESSTTKSHAQQPILPRQRPDFTSGITEKFKTGCGNLYITVNYDEEGICEVFTNTGRAGGCPSQSEATSRLVSIALRSGMDTGAVIEQLKGIRCPSTIRQQGLQVKSCPDAIARALEKAERIFRGQANTPATILDTVKNTEESDRGECALCSSKFSCDIDNGGTCSKICPECKAPLNHEGGCVVCHRCGYSKCG